MTPKHRSLNITSLFPGRLCWFAALALLVCLILGTALAEGPRLAERADIHYTRYHVDRSAVPAWVKHRELTLRLDVTGAGDVWLWADGVLLPVDRRGDTLVVTTAADELLLAAEAPTPSPDLGAVEVAPLYNDYRWAYSLTFDDGELSVLQYAYPELARYSYPAGIAVIGRWLEDPEAIEHGYCSAADIQTLLDVGWSVFNHSYTHFNAPSDISVEDAQRCQDAIYSTLGGYEARVFTVPYTNELWKPIIDDHGQAMGLHLMQLYSDNGGPLKQVSYPISLDGVYHLGRDDIKDWKNASVHYFDRAHELAMQQEALYPWLSLHAHNIRYDQDWCALTESSAYLYHTYGPGGTDEVWVAPADRVYDYFVVRTQATVTRQDATTTGLPEPWQVPLEPWPASARRIERAGQSQGSWHDGHVVEWAPNANYDRSGVLRLSQGEPGERSAVLLHIEPTPPAGDIRVERALLHLYATQLSDSPVEVGMGVRSVLRRWHPQEVTWSQASGDVPWDIAGEDRAAEPIESAHARSCGTGEGRWYTFDVTSLVRDWLEHPETNHGLVIEGEGDGAKTIYFASSDYYLDAQRPALEIVYRWPEPAMPPTPTPTPTQTPLPTLAPPTPTPARVHLPLVWHP